MPYYMYLAISGEKKIAVYTMHPDTGRLIFQEDVPLKGSPGPLATDPAQRYLYAGIRSVPEVDSFRIDHDTGRITLLSTVALEANPCYLTTDRTGRHLLSAYYTGGLVAVHPVGADGAVHGPPTEWRETALCAHYIQTDASNRYAFVPHVAESNRIYQFIFDEKTGTLTPNDPPMVPQPEHTGPRHYVHHPVLDVVYADNEQGGSVTAYRFDADCGTLTPFQTLSTLPEGFEGENTCAQIHIHPQGRFVYASNRGHDSIAGFAVDPKTGALTSIGQQPTEKTPRAFNLDPEGRFLFAGGQGSGNLAGYRVDQNTGELLPLETYAVGQTPSWVMILKLGV